MTFWVSRAGESCSDHLKGPRFKSASLHTKKKGKVLSRNSLSHTPHCVGAFSIGYALTKAQKWQRVIRQKWCSSQFAPCWRTHTLSMFSSSASGRRCGTKMRSDGNGPPTVATQRRAPTSFSLLAELSRAFLELIWRVTTNAARFKLLSQNLCKLHTSGPRINYCNDSTSLLHPLIMSHKLILCFLVVLKPN